MIIDDTSSSSTESSIAHDEQNFDRPADRELIENHLHLVSAAVSRLKRRIPAHVDAQDLHSVGLLGLVQAAQRYTPTADRTFSAYATLRIRGAMLDELRRLDSCSRQARSRAKTLRATSLEISQTLGRDARPEEVRAALDLSPEEFRKWQSDAEPVRHVALDCPLDDEDGRGVSLHDLLADDSATEAFERVERNELTEILARLIAKLPASRQRILTMHYQQGYRIGDIAGMLRVTSSRISQLHARTVKQLREALDAELACFASTN